LLSAARASSTLVALRIAQRHVHQPPRPLTLRASAVLSEAAVMRGVNAAVVGLLGAALYNPVWTSSVKAPGDLAIALLGFVLLTVWRAPPLLVVIISALGGIALAFVT